MPELPPGPTAGVIAQTVRLHRDPLGFLRAAQATFGDVFTIRLATARPLAVVAAPEALAPIADGDPATAHAGEGRRRILPMASPRGTFGADGATHRAARARIAGALSREALEPHRDALDALAERQAAGWPARRPFRLLSRVRGLVDEAFVRCVLAIRDEARARAAVLALRRLLWTPGNPPFTLPGAGDGLAGRLGTAVFARRTAPLRAVLQAEIVARRDGGAPGDDVLGAVLRDEPGVPAEAITDELLVVLMAAQEPPAIALTWLLDRLARGAALGDAVVRETLRLWPPAFAMLRRLTAPQEIAGHALPAGITVVLPTPLLHRDARAFAQPDAFRPERWDGSQDETTYAPFGAGARRCVGEALAHLYMEALLPAVARTVRLEPVGEVPEPMVLRGTVLVPRDGARMQAA